MAASLACTYLASEVEQAIEAYVTGQGEQYAGACADTQLPDDVGQWCSEIRELSDNRATVALGPTFSEFVETVVFERRDGQWQPGQRTPIAAPGVGTGLRANTSADPAGLLMIAGGVFLTVLGGAALLQSSRRRRLG
jgi:hypothetical protein